jgi:predicted nucleic-acid-binding protein
LGRPEKGLPYPLSRSTRRTSEKIISDILVRYVMQDDPIQAATATAWIEERLSPENPGFISVVAIAETVWVLDRTYGVAAQDIAAAIEQLLQADILVIENEQQVFTAKVALKENQGSFADALIAALGAKAGCSSTLTFDSGALRLPGYKAA